MKLCNKIAAALLPLALLASLALPAFAVDEPTPAPTAPVATAAPTPAPAPSEGGSIFVSSYDCQYGRSKLEIRDGGVHQQAYADSVTLLITDERVRQEVIAGNVKVRIAENNFSYAESGAEATVTIANQYAAGTPLSYQIQFPRLNYNGDSNTLKLDIFYEGINSLPVTSVSQSLGQFMVVTTTSPDPTPEPTSSPEPTATPDPTYRTPSLIVRSTSIGASSVDAGELFTLSLEVYATSSGTENLCDVLVAINPAEGVTLTEGSTTKYIGTMSPGTAQTITFPMQAQNSFTGGTSSVSVSLSASGETTGGSCAATGTTVTVPVIQPERFEISNMEVPESIVAGEDGYLSVTFVNKGKNAINNLTATMTGKNLQTAEQSEFVGNLAAGSEQSVDFDLAALEAGTAEGKIMLVYEDSTGAEVSLEQGFSTRVEEPMVYDDSMYMDPGMMEEPEPANNGLAPWVIPVASAVVLLILAAVLYLRKKRKAVKALAEANDEDF